MELLLICVCAWAIAQAVKVILFKINENRFDWRLFFGTGGMPSAHSATVCALATGVGLSYGFNSVLFDITTILAAIVMYDAAGVRRAVSRQATILNRLTRELREKYPRERVEKELRELWGHTPFQVFIGGMIGISVAILWLKVF